MSGTGVPGFRMRREIVDRLADRHVIAVDTIAHLEPEDAGQAIATGSHGGISSAEYAARVPVDVVFFNDAGVGKDEAGLASLPFLQSLGVAAGTVAHDSAIIGDAFETWACGIVSALNPAARDRGFVVGEPLKAALRRVYGEGSS
jgi:hypothetical protein